VTIKIDCENNEKGMTIQNIGSEEEIFAEIKRRFTQNVNRSNKNSPKVKFILEAFQDTIERKEIEFWI
jgi:hypothetical protein